LRNAVLELEILSGGKEPFHSGQGVLQPGKHPASGGHGFHNSFIGKDMRIPGTCLIDAGHNTQAAHAIRHREQVYYGLCRRVEIGGGPLAAHVYLDERRRTNERELFLRALLEGEALMDSQDL
jgi:hypothetical protein